MTVVVVIGVRVDDAAVATGLQQLLQTELLVRVERDGVGESCCHCCFGWAEVIRGSFFLVRGVSPC